MKKNNNHNSGVGISVLLVSVLWVLPGCREKSEPGDGQQKAGAGKAERRFLSIGTAPPGGAFFVVGSAIAEVIGSHAPAQGWQITAEATKGTQENLRRLDKGELEFALADAAFLGGAVPTASITQACATRKIHFIPFDGEAVERLTERYRFFDRKTIPARTYKGQTDDFHGLNVGSMILATSAQVDEETVYLFTKTLFEHAREVTEKHPAGKAINPKNAIRDTGTPFHPGAIRYFREQGIWPQDDDEQRSLEDDNRL